MWEVAATRLHDEFLLAERAHDDHGTQEHDDEGSLGGDSEHVLQGGVGFVEETH